MVLPDTLLCELARFRTYTIDFECLSRLRHLLSALGLEFRS
jgi:hypothetical protein